MPTPVTLLAVELRILWGNRENVTRIRIFETKILVLLDESSLNNCIITFPLPFLPPFDPCLEKFLVVAGSFKAATSTPNLDKEESKL